jgi:magnesium chelatase family protein
VLFLDELGEFPASILDALRQPIEDGFVSIARQSASFRFPTDVQLVAASNPCPCGFLGDRIRGCECVDSRRERYAAKLSGPLLDRFDMRVDVKRLRTASLTGPSGERSRNVRARVMSARQRQTDRGRLNSRLSGPELDDLEITPEAVSALEKSVDAVGLSARGWDRMRRVARTIADLEGATAVASEHIEEAATLRGSRT